MGNQKTKLDKVGLRVQQEKRDRFMHIGQSIGSKKKAGGKTNKQKAPWPKPS